MFRSYDHLQGVNLNKIVNSYWNSVALDRNPWAWSNTRNGMQTTKFKIMQLAVFALCTLITILLTTEHKTDP
jgi:hypothetical protein